MFTKFLVAHDLNYLQSSAGLAARFTLCLERLRRGRTTGSPIKSVYLSL